MCGAVPPLRPVARFRRCLSHKKQIAIQKFEAPELLSAGAPFMPRQSSGGCRAKSLAVT